jgi:NADPH:quinone reductase-like Zn-dependent oxidoreductase
MEIFLIYTSFLSQNSHSTSFATSRPADGAFALYTAVQADKAAILPSHIPFTSGVVLPFALEAAVCALSVREPGPCMPGVLTPALALPYPSLNPPPATTVLVVNGASSSVGSMTTQIAAAAGITVLAISGARNFEVATQSGASEVFDRHSASLVSAIVAAVRATGLEFVGIFDAISSPENYSQDLAILRALGGENTHLACTHPPPTEGVPSGVKIGMIFAVNDVVAPVFRDFVTPALESGLLKCLPAPKVVGKGLEFVNEALKMSKAGVSATKLVVEV